MKLYWAWLELTLGVRLSGETYPLWLPSPLNAHSTFTDAWLALAWTRVCQFVSAFRSCPVMR